MKLFLFKYKDYYIRDSGGISMMSSLRTTFANNVRKTRQEKNLSQEELALEIIPYKLLIKNNL